jgi:hypothetical protein
MAISDYTSYATSNVSVRDEHCRIEEGVAYSTSELGRANSLAFLKYATSMC